MGTISAGPAVSSSEHLAAEWRTQPALRTIDGRGWRSTWAEDKQDDRSPDGVPQSPGFVGLQARAVRSQ